MVPFIYLVPGKTYEILCESGLLHLPSKRTLRDYTHWHKIKLGFDATVINHLREEAKLDSLADWQRYCYIYIAISTLYS